MLFSDSLLCGKVNDIDMITEIDKKVISLIQKDLPVDRRPFASIADKIGITEEKFIERVNNLKKQGIIRRFGATLRHQEAGFSSNAMVAWTAPEDRIEEAGKIFRRALKGEELSPAEVKAFQDHIVFFLADMAGEMELVFQIHTGVQTTWGHIPDSDPLLLIPLIRSHPHVKFDLFHAGYPYSRELGMFGKHYPNVWLNMCWMYVISTAASRQVLREWLDLVPLERILGFGSDVRSPEFIYGHLAMARSALSEVLEGKVREDFWSEGLALDSAKRLMRDNAMALYGLG